jgi:hypothetical protein
LFKVLPDQYVKETYKKSSRAYLNITIPVPIRDAKYIKLLKGKCKAIYGNEYIEESFKNEDNKFEKILKIYSHEISINDMSIGSKGLFTNISFIAKRTDFSIKPRIRDYKIKILLNNGNEIIKKIGYTSEKNNQITFDKDLSKDNILFRNVKDIKIIYFNLSNSKDIKFEFKNIKLH